MNTIIQFECFETSMHVDNFITSWEYYAKKLLDNHVDVTLHERFSGGCKFKFISRHKWPEDSFAFSFMQKRRSGFFDEGSVKITQAGGYAPIQVEKESDEKNIYWKIILLLPMAQANIEEFQKLPFHLYLNIYQSYFESCRYSHILEFFLDEQMSELFLQWLKTNKHNEEAGLYRECMVLHEHE